MPSPTPREIGRRIRRLRTARLPRMTQQDLGAQMQARGHDTITRERINEIEHGRRTLRPDELVSLARIFGVPITQLLGVPDQAPE